ncbi:MAG: hypothetical protein KDK96_00805 [Chlamydiia bacterium]|nr:hypothetical protein [Chlamydiia bacterium]
MERASTYGKPLSGFNDFGAYSRLTRGAYSRTYSSVYSQPKQSAEFSISKIASNFLYNIKDSIAESRLSTKLIVGGGAAFVYGMFFFPIKSTVAAFAALYITLFGLYALIAGGAARCMGE